MPKELNAQTDPYETVDTELVSLQNAYSLEYKDYYGNAIAYHDQFYQVGEFCKGSVLKLYLKNLQMVLRVIRMKAPLYTTNFMLSQVPCCG